MSFLNDILIQKYNFRIILVYKILSRQYIYNSFEAIYKNLLKIQVCVPRNYALTIIFIYKKNNLKQA